LAVCLGLGAALSGCGWATAAIVAATAGGGGGGSSSSPAPAPDGTPTTVTAITPALGPASGGQAVTITGTGFQAGATAGFGGGAPIQLTSVVVVNSTTLTGVTPAAAESTYDVSVINTNATATPLINGYTFDGTPPAFTGAAAGTALSPYSMEVTWPAASDFYTATADIVFDIYLATASGGQNFGAAPFGTSDAGATRFTIGGLIPSTQYFVVVRARDEAGNSDTNTTEVNATSFAAPSPVMTVAISGLMGSPRFAHGSALLSDGQVLVAGGVSLTSIPTATSELYNPATGTWTATTGNIGTARSSFPMVVLHDQRVLIAGGQALPTVYNTAQIYDPSTGTWTAAGTLSSARAWSTATKLQNGHVVIAGGGSASTPLATVDIYDPVAASWTTAPSMGTARQEHGAVLLQDGRVLVAGGRDSATTQTATAEIYDPATGTWTGTGSLAAARFDHTLTVLPKGGVLAVGGSQGTGGLSSCEIWNPATGTWTAAGSLSGNRTEHTASLLTSGRVLVLAGASTPGGTRLSTSEIYSIRVNSWSSGSAVPSVNEHSATMLPSGKVLMVGGNSGATANGAGNLIDYRAPTWRNNGNLAGNRITPSAVVLPDGKVLIAGGNGGGIQATTYLYDPATGTFTSTGNLGAARVGHESVLLRSGKVLTAGGQNGGGSLNSAELYDPVTGTWTGTGSLATPRTGEFGLTMLGDGRVLLSGGESSSGRQSSCEIYDPVTGTWTGTGAMTTTRVAHTQNMLPNGQLLVAGGSDATPVFLTSVDIYNPVTGTWTAANPLSGARMQHGSAVLPDGRILVLGGSSGSQLNTCEIFDPATGNWGGTGTLAAGTQSPGATLLPSGEVLLIGGVRAGPIYTNHTAIYDPALGTWATTASLNAGRYNTSVALLTSNEVLLAGGQNAGGAIASAEVRNPGRGFATFAQPRIDAVDGISAFPLTVNPGTTVTITGVRFRGAPSEASSGGHTSSPSDTPVVTLHGPLSGNSHLRNHPTGRLTTLPAGGFVAGTTAIVTVPAVYDAASNPTGVVEGYYYLRVTVNGIPSEARIVKVEADGALDSGWIGNGVFNFDPSAGQDIVYDMVSDGTSLYIVGSDTSSPRQWRIEKRSLATGALDGTFGSGTGIITVPLATGANEPRAIVHDGTNLYIAGFDEQVGAGNPQWRIEKRLMTTGALVNGFGTNGVIQNNITGNNDTATELVHDGTNLYICGGAGFGVWHIEKRLMSTGALVTGFGTNGIINFQPTTGTNSSVQQLLHDGTNLYVCGYDNPAAGVDWRIEKRLASTGALVNGFGTNGVLNVVNAMYICGQRGATTWRIEKRSMATGALDSTFGGGTGVVSTNPSAGADSASCITLDNGFLYVGGYDTLSGNRATRIVKRNATTGALVPTFGAGGVVRRDIAGGNDELLAILVDGNFLFAAGYDGSVTSTQWHVQKRSK
jgi:N-acetylneuraminic acid mutarotase